MRMKLFLAAILSLLLMSCQAKQEGSAEENVAVKPEVEVVLEDHGAAPLVVDIDAYTLENENFRTALWTGEKLQLTLMSIPVGGEVGLEVHYDIEQFLRIEQGQGKVYMGDAKDNLTFIEDAYDDYAIFVPLGVWHNVKNVGDVPLKIYSIYAKPEHAHSTVHLDKAESDADHHDHDHDHHGEVEEIGGQKVVFTPPTIVKDEDKKEE